ncbi:MAG: hypothetical protein DHS20C14_10430 [Phycisphaeraceae bacterium]|nr:MAG: hypothetical protein DHS20C14_10430 [Phycisphaeraceae bacterium]
MSVRLTREQLYVIIGVGVPGLAVVGVRFMGEGAAAAQAGEVAPGPIQLPRIEHQSPSLDSPRERALTYARQLTPREDIDSPFTPASVVEIDRGGRETTAPNGRAARPTTSGVRFTAIYSTGERLLAVIDGRSWRIGNQVSPGWVIDQISPATQQVRLRHTSGATETLSLHRFD